MFGFARSVTAREAAAKLMAIDRSQATIEFSLDGTILTANANFLHAMGYQLTEVQGRHHSIFVEPSYRDSDEYSRFWERLNRGEFIAAQFKRIGKGGREVWIEAAYNPVIDRHGKPYKVVKYATDVTAAKTRFADLKGQVESIHKSQGVIEFALDGTVLNVNDKFLDCLGYTLDEVRGRHHGMFVDAAYRDSESYRVFWESLNRGLYQAGQFRRIGKRGREVWIEASYNPILDLNGRPFKVVKFATDITSAIENLSTLKLLFTDIDQAIGRTTSQAGMASGAVQTTTATVQAIAASAEELASSVHEIAAMMSQSRVATDAAADQAGSAGLATQRLTESSASMGGIVAVIRSIAGQINLLALNATIESARAGEAGRGFAVVAGEVKNLAQQAANATNQIAAEIERLQAVSGEVVAALAGVGKSIDAIRGFVTTTASAVEEQSSVTRQMSQGMQTTAGAVVAINDNMTEIASAVIHLSAAVGNAREAAKVLVR